MDGWIDQLEAELGLAARLRLVANCGGQTRTVPSLDFAARSKLAQEAGPETASWLAQRFAQTKISIPSHYGHETRDRTASLRAAILEAGLTEPTRSANEIAKEFGVTATWVHELRARMRSAEANGQEERLATLLRAAITAADLTVPTRTPEEIAKEFGVSAKRVRKLRRRLIAEHEASLQMELPF